MHENVVSQTSGIADASLIDEFMKKSTDARTVKTSKLSQYDFRPTEVFLTI
jgi:hypothetical protein